jgi:predicted NBD/HSP70 family sugar kinase
VAEPVVIGVDIGGTKTKAGAVPVTTGGVADRLLVSSQIATPRTAPPGFYDAMAEMVRQVCAQARQQGAVVLPLAAVAHPGRFLPDGSLARGTTPNLGLSDGQFDGCRPAQELARRLGFTVAAENDAVAQMRFGLDALLRDPTVRPQLLGEAVVYVGPGTGMGGGVARVGPEGNVAIMTDGHLFDMQVPGYGDGTLTAEEVFTGPAIARELARRNRALSPPIEPATGGRLDEILLGEGPAALPSHLAEARRIAETYGELFARLIAAIHEGRVVKVRLETAADGFVRRHVDEPDRAWSAEDCATVRGARRLLFGGWLGCSQGLGKAIRGHALEWLRQQGLGEVMIFLLPAASADAGLLGAVTGLPLTEIRRHLCRIG